MNDNGRYNNGRVNNLVGNANKQPTQKYMGTVKNNVHGNALRNVPKNIKNYPPKPPKRRKIFTVGIATIAFLGGYTVNSIKDYKEEAYKDALNAVKTSISKSVGKSIEDITIMNNSSILGSSSSVDKYVVTIGDTTYTYEALINDGYKPLIRIDEINNQNINRAIQIVASAKDGYLCNALQAKKLVEKIENGEINLDMSEAVMDKWNNKQNNGWKTASNIER